MNSPTISRLRTEWQALGTAPPSSAACHCLFNRRPDDSEAAKHLCSDLKYSGASDCVRVPTEDPLPVAAGQRSLLAAMLIADGTS